MSSESPFLVSVSTNTGVDTEQTTVVEGVQGWQECPHIIREIPERLLGGTLVRFPFRSTPAGTNIALTVAGADARVYVLTEASSYGSQDHRAGGLAQRFAASLGWLAEDCAPLYGEETIALSVFSAIVQRGMPMVLPTIADADPVLAIVVVPVFTGSFAVSITSNSHASYDRMVVVEEGVTAWNDRDHRYIDVPSCLLNGVLFQGPYKDVAEGTVLTVRPNARARVYVILERSCSGGLHESLPAQMWRAEEYAPRWHEMPTMLMFGIDCNAGCALVLPPTRTASTVLSVVVVPVVGALVAPVEVSCCTPGGAALPALDPVLLTEGSLAWSDSDQRIREVPPWMLGATLFRGPQAGPPAGAVLTIRPAAPSVVYVIVEEENDGSLGRSGGLLPRALPDAKWERRADSPKWDGGSKLAVYAKRVGASDSICTPALSIEAGAIMALVVKVDVEAFDASVKTSEGIEYGRAAMAETCIAWSDCNNRLTWVPGFTKGGMLFRGPHKTTPSGTRVRISASGAFRAYVMVEAEYKGKEARTGGYLESLPTAGFHAEAAAPSWGDTASTMKVFSRMIPEGEELILPATVGEVVFIVVVVNVASGPERLAEELKRAFKSWDASGKGGIRRGDLAGLLSVLAPDMDKEGCDVLLNQADRSGSGLLSYEDLIDRLILG